MISLVDRPGCGPRGAGAQQRCLPLWHKRLAEIIDLTKNLDDPIQHHRLRHSAMAAYLKKAFQSQSLNRAKTPYPGYLNQPDGFAGAPPGSPCPACGGAAGPDLRRLVQLPVANAAPVCSSPRTLTEPFHSEVPGSRRPMCRVTVVAEAIRSFPAEVL